MPAVDSEELKLHSMTIPVSFAVALAVAVPIRNLTGFVLNFEFIAAAVDTTGQTRLAEQATALAAEEQVSCPSAAAGVATLAVAAAESEIPFPMVVVDFEEAEVETRLTVLAATAVAIGFVAIDFDTMIVLALGSAGVECLKFVEELQMAAVLEVAADRCSFVGKIIRIAT